MSDADKLKWRTLERSAAPYTERSDPTESQVDRVLLAALAGMKRPFSRALARASRVARLTESEQRAADACTDVDLRERADALRGGLLRHGFAPELVARAFALVRTAANRTVGLRHFPVQLMGGHVMLEGMLAEMGTGEGKTLAATLPAATAALAGMPVHIVTVNDYLAKRDGEWMGPLYAALGLTVGIVQHGQQPEERRAAYAADITYCTNKDLGFDYLRDTLALASRCGRGRLLLEKTLGRGDRLDRLLLRGLHFAIVDEADSVLIDEARTPLIIAGAADKEADEALYHTALAIAGELERDVDFRLDLSERAARLSAAGRRRLETLGARLPSAWRSARAREELAQQSLAALHLFARDAHYIVREGKVQIVDEYTGRVLADRTWERGLQQLIEAKEACEVSGRQLTLARITYQRLFRRYLRLAGMTGTATEVASELEAVYDLKAVRIPPNRPSRRRNAGVRLYASHAAKWQAAADTIARVQAEARPILVGTRSVAASEALSAVLASRGIDHVVLNARQDSAEAAIVAEAGEAGRVTVATNMAGRGTDIRLGEGVPERGGLHVILTEYHESHRVDRQLFGRCGRQGDPGSYETIVSLEDELFVRHAGALCRTIAARHGASWSRPLPLWEAVLLRAVAQRAAESANSHARRVTVEQDRKLDSALAFAGKAE
jgi:preprotein translocase subunit SecA